MMVECGYVLQQLNLSRGRERGEGRPKADDDGWIDMMDESVRC